MEAEIGDLDREVSGASDSSVMILTCPECATSYFVDDARVPANGRSVKCSNCGARWIARPGDGAPPEPQAATPRPPRLPEPFSLDTAMMSDLEVVAPAEVGPAPPKAAPVGRPASARGAVGGAHKAAGGGKLGVWIGAALAVVVLVGAAILFRSAVVSRFPAAQRAYAGVGLPVDSLGLAIEGLRAQPTFEGGRPALTVSGSIRNERAPGVTAPPLRISLLDRSGTPVATKIATPIDGRIPGRATRYFAVTLLDPPASAHDLKVTFEARDSAAGQSGPAAIAPVPAIPAAEGAKPPSKHG